MSTTWLDLPDDTPFGLDNLPYGVWSPSQSPDHRRIGVRVGDQILDAAACSRALADPYTELLSGATLNPLMAAGPEVWRAVRGQVLDWLGRPELRGVVEPCLHPVDDAILHLPFEVADYVDFYSSEHHAVNVGRMFRPGAAEPLPPNWRHQPVGYHGRAGTVVVSGTPVIRPTGQYLEPGADTPTFGPSVRLDMEAEVGFVVGVPSQLGQRVPMSALPDHVFGVCLVNDWSARDLQAWEYVPLGPFLGKSFATSVSPWVVPLDALRSARITPPPRAQGLLPYLDDANEEPWGLDIQLTVTLNGHPVSHPPFSTMYYTCAQQLSQLTVNGASLRTGDLFASGTVSGPERAQQGSFLELSWAGTDPVPLPNGQSREFLADGDQITISASAPGPAGARIGFGEVSGMVLPATSPGQAAP